MRRTLGYHGHSKLMMARIRQVSYLCPGENLLQVFETKTDKEKVKRKRKKKDGEEKDKEKLARRPSNTSTNSTAVASETEIPKKRRRKDKGKVVKVKQEEIVDVEEDDDDGDDELCAAASCTRPQGDEVGWVQCDVCEKWYHLACVGLSPEKAEAMDSYNCRLCVGGGSSTNSAGGTPVAASPESEHIDVDGTTPSATSPTSPIPPVCIVDVEGTEAVQQQQQQEDKKSETARASVIQGTSEKPRPLVATIDLCSDTESTQEDMEADGDVDIELETQRVPPVITSPSPD